MALDQTLPNLWLISDARNDAHLEAALRALPRESGFIYRHYHLPDPDRWQRFQALRRVAEACGHMVVLSDSALTATEWGAHGVYGAPLARGLRDLARVVRGRKLHQTRAPRPQR
ncbi:MAG: hypothetical protein AAFW59_10255 [Pseudomonadota bacterium]